MNEADRRRRQREKRSSRKQNGIVRNAHSTEPGNGSSISTKKIAASIGRSIPLTGDIGANERKAYEQSNTTGHQRPWA
jgi:hypothetical protein